MEHRSSGEFLNSAMAAPAPPIRRSFDSAARRRSTERNLSQRRYDDHWGAAEGADCRAKCADGRILHIHSQLLSLASPVLRDMLTLLLPQQQVEARDGPAYLLALDDDSAALAAALDMVYPTAHLAPPTWADLEGALIVADKYDMAGVRERCLSALLEPRREWLLDASSPGGLLRWLGLTQSLQLPELHGHLLFQLQRRVPALACDPSVREELLRFAAGALDRPLLLQLLRAVLEGAAAAIPARASPPATRRASDAGRPSVLGHPVEYDLACALQALMGRSDGGNAENGEDGRRREFGAEQVAGGVRFASADGSAGGSGNGSRGSSRRSGDGRGYAPAHACAAAAAAQQEGVATSGEGGGGTKSGSDGAVVGACDAAFAAAPRAGLAPAAHQQWLGSALYSGASSIVAAHQAAQAAAAFMEEATDIDTALAATSCGEGGGLFGLPPVPQRKRHRPGLAVVHEGLQQQHFQYQHQHQHQQADAEAIWRQLQGGGNQGGGAGGASAPELGHRWGSG